MFSGKERISLLFIVQREKFYTIPFEMKTYYYLETTLKSTTYSLLKRIKNNNLP